jgi:crotonobetainyl-CoA:carnitine CoA-transferase CaiB-like acyl-CoA transferase
VLDLIRKSDVVLENARPGQMEKLGIGEEVCRQINPDVVYVGISGFGQVGPLASRPAYDAIGQAASGLMDSITNGAPPSVGPALGDIASGLVGATAALGGLAGRGVHGRGWSVRTSMLEALTCVISDALLHYAAYGVERTREDRATRSQVFSLPCSDDRFVMIQLSNSSKFFANMLHAVGLDELGKDPRFADYGSRMANQAELQRLLGEVFINRPSAEWEKALSDSDVPASVVMTVSDVLAHPQTEALGLFGPSESDGLRRYRGPWTIDGQRPESPGPAPALGQDTREIFISVLGKSQAELLLEAGVLLAGEPAR